MSNIKIRHNGYPHLFPSDDWLEAQKSIPLKQRLLEYIYFKRAVTFAELEAYFGDEFKGTKELGFPEFNIVVWPNVSERFAKTFMELEHEGLISKYIGPMSILGYFHDCKVLSLPIAKRQYKYKSLRWMPVLLNPTDKCRELVVDDE